MFLSYCSRPKYLKIKSLLKTRRAINQKGPNKIDKVGQGIRALREGDTFFYLKKVFFMSDSIVMTFCHASCTKVTLSLLFYFLIIKVVPNTTGR